MDDLSARGMSWPQTLKELKNHPNKWLGGKSGGTNWRAQSRSLTPTSFREEYRIRRYGCGGGEYICGG